MGLRFEHLLKKCYNTNVKNNLLYTNKLLKTKTISKFNQSSVTQSPLYCQNTQKILISRLKHKFYADQEFNIKSFNKFLSLYSKKLNSEYPNETFFKIRELSHTSFSLSINYESLTDWTIYKKYLNLTSIIPLIKEVEYYGADSLYEYNYKNYTFSFTTNTPQILYIQTLPHVPQERYVWLVDCEGFNYIKLGYTSNLSDYNLNNIEYEINQAYLWLGKLCFEDVLHIAIGIENNSKLNIYTIIDFNNPVNADIDFIQNIPLCF